MDGAKDRGASPAQVALAWLLDRPAVASLIIGARTDEQLADNLGAADLSLTAEELARLEEVSRPPLLYPYWHQAKTAIDKRLAGIVAPVVVDLDEAQVVARDPLDRQPARGEQLFASSPAALTTKL